MKNKKNSKPRCPMCLIGGYMQFKCETGDGRPFFKCSRCDASWTYGKDGGEYALGEKE